MLETNARLKAVLDPDFLLTGRKIGENFPGQKAGGEAQAQSFAMKKGPDGPLIFDETGTQAKFESSNCR